MELTLALLILMQIEIMTGLAAVFYRRRRTGLKRPTFVDTSVLMDGRIVSAVQAGFVPNTIIVPESVLAELQTLADGSDSDKRARARHGLDLVTVLQEAGTAKVSIMKDGKATTGVDDRLLELARKYRGSICTIDFNLNKVATASGIPVLNINELAKQLRMNHLPGEKVSLNIIQKGNDAHQGIGYMSDGTMVVVEQAQSDIGKTIEVEFIRSLQTAAGRMLFAKKLTKPERKKPDATKNRQNGSTTPPVKATGRRGRSKTNREDELIKLANSQD